LKRAVEMAIVACMGPRLHPERVLSLEVGDASVIRNAGATDFLPFSDLDASVRDDVDTIRSYPLVPDGMPVPGYVYEVETGRLRSVVTS
jgi:carbonic anhydrase